MNLYAWQPKGHGPYSFFVVEETEEDAVEAVKQFIKHSGGPKYFNGIWPKDYTLKVFLPGDVAINNND